MTIRLILLLLSCATAQAATIELVVRIIPSAEVQLRDARSISVAPDGTLFIADTGHHRIVAVDSSGGLVVESGGFGTEHGQFEWPRTVIANRGASVWVLDYGNRRIEKFSRSMEYQGTLVLPSEDDSAPPQIEACALSPQSDLYLYDRDGGRVLRFDPLFREQAELGRDRGDEFVSALSRMTFVPELGLVWWEHGSDRLRFVDPLLTQTGQLRLGLVKPSSLVLAALDSCLVYGIGDELMQWCGTDVPGDTLLSLASSADLPLKRLDDVAFANRGNMYVLDGLAGAIYRVSLSER